MGSVIRKTTVSGKGQITIPKEICERLELQRGEKVSFELTEDGTVHLRKEGDPLDELRELREKVSSARRASKPCSASRNGSGAKSSDFRGFVGLNNQTEII